MIVLFRDQKDEIEILPKIIPIFVGFTNVFENRIWTILIALIVVIILSEIKKSKSLV